MGLGLLKWTSPVQEGFGVEVLPGPRAKLLCLPLGPYAQPTPPKIGCKFGSMEEFFKAIDVYNKKKITRAESPDLTLRLGLRLI